MHAAAQPSHDKAAEIPFDDFDTNAVGTLNVLEAARQFAPEAPFIHMSTNKVYGDAPNKIKLKELETRWDYDDEHFMQMAFLKHSYRPKQAFFIWCFQTGGRYYGAGIWPIF